MNRHLLADIRRLAGDRCDYCRMPTAYDPLPFQVDHIIAQQHGGITELSNLAWTCLHCNKHKGPNIAGIDPLTRQISALYHPRRQQWERNFAWKGPLLVGKTRAGRATIQVLAINDFDLLALREELLDEGVYHRSE